MDMVTVVEKHELSNEDIEFIMEKYANGIYQLALVKTKNPDQASDIFQEVFYKLTKSRKPFESEEHTKAWLIRVTLNCCVNMWQSAWFRHTVPIAEYEEKSEKGSETESLDQDDDVYKSVMKLPEKYRVPIHLFYYEELSLAEISNVMGIKSNTVATRLNRGRNLLKENLKGEYSYERFSR